MTDDANRGTGPGPVLVTGGSSGLGAAVVAAVAGAGGVPVSLDLRPPLAEIDHEIVDLADSRGAEAATRRAVERHPDLRAVVTAAGIDAHGRLGDVPGPTWDRVVAVNLLGTAAVVRAALPTLTANRGTIVTVASTLGLRARGDATAYCASKFGVVGFTRALSAELAGTVGVTLVIPGGPRPAVPADRACPTDVATAVLGVLAQPDGCAVRELVVLPPAESSWP